MNHSHAPGRGRIISPFCFASLALACSGYYPLGEASDVSLPLEGDGATGQAGVGDARVPAGLAAPEITLSGFRSEPGPGSLAAVGDLDGDGRDEMAVSDIDFPAPIAYVQLYYSGPRPSDAEQVFAFAHSGPYLTLPGDNWLALGVTAAGDIDGDGYGDLLLRTQDCDVTEPGEGAYLVYGGPERLSGSTSLTDVAVHFAPSPREVTPPDGYGLSCSGSPPLSPAGDIDGDGFDDLVINREPITDTTNGDFFRNTGEGVYVFYGRSQRFSGEVALESADAIFHTSIDDRVAVYPRGDVDGDGLADVIVSSDAYRSVLPGSFLLRGSSQRFSGTQQLEQSATVLTGAFVTTGGWSESAGDLDGDGASDLILFDESFQRHLFYGGPGLFEAGFDFDQAAASLSETAGYVFPAGDRDGDGDAELLEQFSNPNQTELLASIFSDDIAFVSGSSERLSGTLAFPEAEVNAAAPAGPFGDQRSSSGDFGRALRYAIPAGDLDGDGADDLFTTSGFYEIQGDDGYQVSDFQIHIHFGVPARPQSVVR